MIKPDIILVGAGGHAHACIDVIEQQNKFRIAGLIGSQEEMHSRHFGYSVIATDNDLPELIKEYQHVLIAVGQIKSPDSRIRLYQKVIEFGFNLPVIISPSAYVSQHSVVAAGSIVMHGAVINAGVRVGNNCIINTRALLEHDAIVDDHSHLSTGAILNGNVHVGSGSFVGSGSIVKEGVSLGKGCVVGMGVAVRHNLGDYVQFVGNS